MGPLWMPPTRKSCSLNMWLPCMKCKRSCACHLGCRGLRRTPPLLLRPTFAVPVVSRRGSRLDNGNAGVPTCPNRVPFLNGRRGGGPMGCSDPMACGDSARRGGPMGNRDSGRRPTDGDSLECSEPMTCGDPMACSGAMGWGECVGCGDCMGRRVIRGRNHPGAGRSGGREDGRWVGRTVGVGRGPFLLTPPPTLEPLRAGEHRRGRGGGGGGNKDRERTTGAMGGRERGAHGALPKSSHKASSAISPSASRCTREAPWSARTPAGPMKLNVRPTSPGALGGASRRRPNTAVRLGAHPDVLYRSCTSWMLYHPRNTQQGF